MHKAKIGWVFGGFLALSAFGGAVYQGNPTALIVVANGLHGVGMGEVSKPFYVRVAEQGYAPAAYMLGYYSLTGEYGFPQSNEEAYKWYVMAVGLGSQTAAADVSILAHQGIVFERGSFADVAKDVPADVMRERQVEFDELFRRGEIK